MYNRTTYVEKQMSFCAYRGHQNTCNGINTSSIIAATITLQKRMAEYALIDNRS